MSKLLMATLVAIAMCAVANAQNKICINGRCYDRMPVGIGPVFAWPMTVEPPKFAPPIAMARVIEFPAPVTVYRRCVDRVESPRTLYYVR